MPRCVLCAAAVFAATLAGCAYLVPGEKPREAVATAFSHDQHLAHFARGDHRQDQIAMHLKAFDATEAPEELAQGRCAECHDDLAEMSCGNCHALFQQEAVRARKEARPCMGCHRGTWSGGPATLPQPVTCAACHAKGGPAASGTMRVRLNLPGPEYAGGARASSLPANVYFSHRAHVRFGGVQCARCHARDRAAGSTPAIPEFTMIDCLRCHVENGARTDCLTCHK